MRPVFASCIVLAGVAAGERIKLNSHTSTAARSNFSQDELLHMVDEFLANQPRGANGLLQTYGPGALAGGNCGPHCDLPDECPAKTAATEVNRWCRHDSYDNALAAIYLTKRGKFDEAAEVLGSLIRLMYPTDFVAHSYGPHEMPSGRRFSLLAASYTVLPSSAGDYWTPQTTASGSFVDTGNNAWVGMAFSRYAAATGSSCHALVAHDLMHVLRKHRCDDRMGGFMGRMDPTNMFYRSIEHNIDMFAFARALGAREDEESAGRFVWHMYGERHGGSYRVGTTGRHRCDDNVNTGGIPIDGQLWSIAAGVETSISIGNRQHADNAMDFAIRHPGNAPWAHQNGGWASDTDHIGRQADGAGSGEAYHGFRFSDRGTGVQWEITASGVIAMVRYREGGGNVDVSSRIQEARDSLKRLLHRYGSVPASVRGGNYNAYRTHRPWERFPGGSDTGLGWTYLRYPHVASTVWTGLMLIQQAEDGAPVDAEGNPFAPPAQEVPAASTSDLTCLTPPPPPLRTDGCAPLTAPENRECRSHVEWALQHGRGHPQAGEWYADMRRITGMSHADASADDWQKAAYCGIIDTQCGLPPCSCTHPPCGSCPDAPTPGEATPEPSPTGQCESLSAPANARCRTHVEWAFQHGKHRRQAGEWYEDMHKFTGRSHVTATIDDWQRAAFCGIMHEDCELPPCTCSNPPCGGCGDEE